MKKICLIDSTYPINTRTKKIFDSLISVFGDENVFVIAWNRDERDVLDNEKYFIFKRNVAYGNKIKKLCYLLSFKTFIYRIVKKNDFDVIIASHWETLFLASLLKKNFSMLVYENLDIPTSSNGIVLWILQKLERYALKRTDAIIFASRFFVPLYDFFKKEKILLENKPDTEILLQEKKMSKKLNIVFLGVIRYLDILKNLMNAVTGMSDVDLYIWGDGPDFNDVSLFAKNKTNIFVKGRYDNSQLQDIYSTADLVWAVYPNRDYNVKYAISNKFHESISLGKPCVFAENTKLGDFVNSNGIGFIVDPYSIEGIRNLFINLREFPQAMESVSRNLMKLKKKMTSWNEDFDVFVSLLKK